MKIEPVNMTVEWLRWRNMEQLADQVESGKKSGGQAWEEAMKALGRKEQTTH